MGLRTGVASNAAMVALRRQLEKCEEKLKQCEEEEQKLIEEIEELKRKEQELLKVRLCSLLAEIRINKLVTKKTGIDEYVDNDTDVSPELKLRLELTGELFDVGFKYGKLIVMLVTACVLAGVIARGEAIDILKSEGLLDMDLWILNNENYAVNYLNSLRIIVEGDTSAEYLKFRQELSR